MGLLPSFFFFFDTPQPQRPPQQFASLFLIQFRIKIATTTSTIAGATYVCQFVQSITQSRRFQPEINRPTWKTTKAATQANADIPTSCPIAHFHEPVSRRTTAVVGRH